MRRTHKCNEIKNLDENIPHVIVAGWVQNIRNHGKLIFLDLRDQSGIIQIVFDLNNKLLNDIKNISLESVIAVEGIVKNKQDAKNQKEILAISFKVHSLSLKNLPFEINSKKNLLKEELILTYRYLYLRNKKNITPLIIRHNICNIIRNILNQKDFLEIEMPILTKSTPEGAREFLVPSRLNYGQFYALSQSPQQYKQLLMVGGIEKYYSFAKCFRDEDSRTDRQPEFTQIDLEMSFIEKKDILSLVEELLFNIFKKVLNYEIEYPLKKISYYEAITQYGSENPDTRFNMKIQDISKFFINTKFEVFKRILSEKGVIKAINVNQLSDITRKEWNEIDLLSKHYGYNNISYIKNINNAFKSNLIKFLSQNEVNEIIKFLNIKNGDLIIIISGNKWKDICELLGKIRVLCAEILVNKQRLNLQGKFSLLWVDKFPYLLQDDFNNFSIVHHPFTSPLKQDINKLETNPLEVKADNYDLVLNGTEIGSGSIRINDYNLQKKIFKKFLKMSPSEINLYFNHLLNAFKYGVPPHGGIAIGLDRLCSILIGEKSIKSVIAFPKNQKGKDLMILSPNNISKNQLNELNINIKLH